MKRLITGFGSLNVKKVHNFFFIYIIGFSSSELVLNLFDTGVFFSNRFPFTLFHFILRFWNQTLTCLSVKSKLTAISYRLSLVK